MSLRNLACLMVSVISASHATEVQDHGLAFERLVIHQLTGQPELKKSYTAEWDIPAEANPRTGLPISIKFTEWKNSVYLGDALRQRSIDHPFEMVVGFYQPVVEGGRARIVAVHHLTFQPETWRDYWGSVTLEDLQQLFLKAKSGSITEAQNVCRPVASELRKKSGLISINPKINKDQRRIQCSIPFSRFYEEVLHQNPEPQDRLELFGRSFSETTPWTKRERGQLTLRPR